MKENQKNGRRMDGRETEEKIIECAGQLIAEKGFASVTSKGNMPGSRCESGGGQLPFWKP